jgi:hypothetical protein
MRSMGPSVCERGVWWVPWWAERGAYRGTYRGDRWWWVPLGQAGRGEQRWWSLDSGREVEDTVGSSGEGWRVDGGVRDGTVAGGSPSS